MAAFTPEDEPFVKTLLAKAIISSAAYPLSCVKTLIQLGHEPFPLSTGRTLVVAGRNAYFLPNVFSYGYQLSKQNGISVLFTGVDSAFVNAILQGYATHTFTKYLDTHYPEVGGKPICVGLEEKDMDDHQSFRIRLRSAIRISVIRTATVVVSRPFTVVMVRQVAQLIGKETKYTNVFSSLGLIGREEGPAGLFSGLVPEIIGELMFIWGVYSLSYLVERGMKRAGMYEIADEKVQRDVREVRKFIKNSIPFVVNCVVGYQYTVVSTVMAVSGSGLAVSFLPYSPSFTTWQSAREHLHPHGLKRGARIFFREQTGAVTVGMDQQLYAINKHFV